MYTDANMGEALEMRIYDRNFEMSDNQMQVMLDKAALEEHGFKLEIISKLVRDPDSEGDKPVYQKDHEVQGFDLFHWDMLLLLYVYCHD